MVSYIYLLNDKKTIVYYSTLLEKIADLELELQQYRQRQFQLAYRNQQLTSAIDQLLAENKNESAELGDYIRAIAQSLGIMSET